MNIQMKELAQVGPRPAMFTQKGQPVQPTPIRGTLKNSYRQENGHSYVWCELLGSNRFEWIREDRLIKVML